ncbi:MAG: glycosyltransferase family 39 protein [Candidatus Altiarchaeota archaeon]
MPKKRRPAKKQRAAAILFLLIVLNIALRAPVSEHLLYHDSYVSLWKSGKIIQLSQAIDDDASLWRIDYGRLASPASTAGRIFQQITDFRALYVLPSPIIHPLAVASHSLVTSTGPENSASTYSILYGVLACLGAYFMACELTRDGLVRYLTALLYSTAPAFLQVSSSTHMSRGLIACTLPIALLFALRYRRTCNKKYMVLSLLTGVMLVLAHRIGYVVFALLLAYLSSSALAKKKLKSASAPQLYLAALAALAFYPLTSRQGIFLQALWDYRNGMFATGWTLKPLLTNMLVDYYSSLGILTVFAAAGLIMLAKKLAKPSFNELYLASYLLFLAPFTVFGEYMQLLFLPVLAYLTASGFNSAGKYLGSNLAVAITVSLIASVCFSLFMVNHWAENTKIPYLKLAQQTSPRLLSLTSHVNALPGKVASPEYVALLSPYMAYYLKDDDKVFYIPDSANHDLEDAPYLVRSETLRKTWTPPFAGDQNFTVSGSCKNADLIYSDAVFDVIHSPPSAMHALTLDLTGAFRGLEKIMGLCDGGFIVTSPDGKKILSVSRYLTHGIEGITEVGPRNISIKTSDGKTLLLSPSGLQGPL